MSNDQLLKAPRESLPPLLQQAQDDAFGVEEMRAKLDMPLSHDPKVSKRYIKKMLQVHGEDLFPFQHLTECRDREDPNCVIIKYDLLARAWIQRSRCSSSEWRLMVLLPA